MRKTMLALAIGAALLTGCGGGGGNKSLTIHNPDGSMSSVNPSPSDTPVPSNTISVPANAPRVVRDHEACYEHLVTDAVQSYAGIGHNTPADPHAPPCDGISDPDLNAIAASALNDPRVQAVIPK